MILRNFIIATVAILHVNCGSAQSNKENIPASKEEFIEGGISQTDSLKQYLSVAKKMREDLLVKLKKVTPAEADKIYMDGNFRFEGSPYFNEVYNYVNPIMFRWIIYGNTTSEDTISVQLLHDNGLIPIYIGEGEAGLGIVPDYYYSLFSPYVTKETKEFIRILSDITSDHNNYCYVIPPDILFARVIEWEKYLKEYPHTKYMKDVVEYYRDYMSQLMFNTFVNDPAFDPETGEMNSSLFKELKGIASKQPASKSLDILKEYMKELEANNFTYSKELEDKIMSLWILNNNP